MTDLGRIGIIVAARMSSTRLPGKALLPLQGRPMILFLLKRLRALTERSIVLATTTLAADDELAALVENEGVPVFRGADADVVARYVDAARHFGFETVARVTGDCPFVNAELVQWCIEQASRLPAFDLATTKRRFPIGLDVEIYRSERMAELHESGSLTPAEREHLTLHFYDHRDRYCVEVIAPPETWPSASRSFTVDTRQDYEDAVALAARFPGYDFPLHALLAGTAT